MRREGRKGHSDVCCWDCASAKTTAEKTTSFGAHVGTAPKEAGFSFSPFNTNLYGSSGLEIDLYSVHP